MPFVPALNTAEVVIMQELAGQTVDNVINFQAGGALTIPDLNIIATEVRNAWIATVADVLTEALLLIAIKVTDLTTVSSPSVTVPDSSGTNGDIAAPPTSNNVALVLSESTDQRGRSYRGRIYCAGLPSDQRTNATLMSEAYQASFVAAWTAFFAAVESDTGHTHVIVSRQNNGVARTNAVMTEVTGYSANRQLDSQRRRLEGRGV